MPFAAAEGAIGLGTAAVGAGLGTAGAVVGGTTAAVTGYPVQRLSLRSLWQLCLCAGGAYGSYAYAPGYANAPDYRYAPGSYGSLGFARDIGHGYYNGFAAPASQDNCAVDAGYGRLDYSVACGIRLRVLGCLEKAGSARLLRVDRPRGRWNRANVPRVFTEAALAICQSLNGKELANDEQLKAAWARARTVGALALTTPSLAGPVLSTSGVKAAVQDNVVDVRWRHRGGGAGVARDRGFGALAGAAIGAATAPRSMETTGYSGYLADHGR